MNLHHKNEICHFGDIVMQSQKSFIMCFHTTSVSQPLRFQSPPPNNIFYLKKV